MPTIEIDVQNIFELVDQLDQKNKMELFERLKPRVLKNRWDDLFARIDERRAMYPMDEAEIAEETSRARKELSNYRR